MEKEHVELLKQGVVQWNTWRAQHPKIQPELGYTDLSFLNAHGPRIDLSDANLAATYLSTTDLSGATLKGANLDSANLSFANLRARAEIKVPSIAVI
jgi:uncharacterized protein YjbI with pentapeptide repeats